MDALVIKMVYERSTKNTHRFRASNGEEFIDTLYINKEAFKDGKPPEGIYVKIEAVEEVKK